MIIGEGRKELFDRDEIKTAWAQLREVGQLRTVTRMKQLLEDDSSGI